MTTGGAAAARRQQRAEELCAAAIRALAGDADLHYRGRRLHRGRAPLPLFAPHLHPAPADDDAAAALRGAADGIALRLLHSQAALHARLRPRPAAERLVFEMLEQFRVEAMAPARMPGLRHNLSRRFADWSIAFHRSGLTESSRGLLLYTVAQACRSRVTGEPVLEETEDLMEGMRARLAPLIGHALAGLRRDRHDQAAYAAHALAIARAVGELDRIAADQEGAPPEAEADDEAARERAAFSLLMELDDDGGEAIAQVQSGRSRVLDEAQGAYRVFTTAHDRELPAASAARPEQLEAWRAQLDRRLAAEALPLARMARALKALLARDAADGWDDGQEEGRVDGRRLAQLVASPAERRVFRRERELPLADAVVSFLIDCSGSMKAHAETVAVLVDGFARALEGAGVASEVLGFSTGAWNGGRAQRDWQRAGAPRHPGRLNERLHLVFKAADTRWHRARPGIAALLKADLFREGLDGEAVQWACARLRERPQARRLLIVISDGCPMDSATARANDAHYLDAHLADVAGRIEEAGDVELLAVGVGLDLSPYYGRSIALDFAAQSVRDAVHEILRALAQPRRR